VLLLVSVPFGLIAPLLYLGQSFGGLRYFIYPLFVAAGWGLYEVALSKRPKRAVGLIFACWIVAAPVTLWAMSDPELGQEEHIVVQSLLTGQSAQQLGFDNPLDLTASVANYLKEDLLPEDDQATVAVDAYQGWSVTAQMPPEYLGRFVTTSDRRFRAILRDPLEHSVSYLLIPKPEKVPQDEIVRIHPKLWAGDELGFELVKEFPETHQEWRLYKVVE
jgi:hypothetical protein